MATNRVDRRFVVTTKLDNEELAALRRLAQNERLPVAQVMRRLIWREAQTLQPMPATPAREGVRHVQTA